MQKFFHCKHCGNIVGAIGKMRAPISCCGEKMAELVPNTVEAATEKHLPAVTVSGDKVSVTVGSVEHPMTEEHYIGFIYLETENGGQRKFLVVGGPPKAEFALTGDKPVAVYAYCNLHGMWKTEL
ncbi:MAG: desulfoferrodoxin [Oscillospiraceae bacterium]|nr:desulfoferrodoxin [Oscillospiraceae bacterium]